MLDCDMASGCREKPKCVSGDAVESQPTRYTVYPLATETSEILCPHSRPSPGRLIHLHSARLSSRQGVRDLTTGLCRSCLKSNRLDSSKSSNRAIDSKYTLIEESKTLSFTLDYKS